MDSLLNPFELFTIPLGHWVEVAIRWLVTNFRPAFKAARWPVDLILGGLDSTLHWVPPLVLVLIIVLIAWQVSGIRLAIQTCFWLLLLGFLGVWSATITTLSLVLTAVFFCVVIGIPLGIVSARSDKFELVLRPLLDGMQTTPAFVYLIPVVMLFGIGDVPGVVVTIIFALPPLIRLTNLGIRQVPSEMIEASRAFGATPFQELFKVQLPLAVETIMAGVNQTLMLALSMVVIASMISVGGLGQMVLRGIGRLDMGLATVGGVGIVVMAIVIDRITQSTSGSQARKHGVPCYKRGPIGLVAGLFPSKTTTNIG